MASKKDADRARAEIAKLRDVKPPPCGEPMRSWYVKYTLLVVDFMLTLPDARLEDWENLFTALYELTGMGFHHFAARGVRTENEAWSRVDPWEHMLRSRMFSLLPEGKDAQSYAEDYLVFIVYLGREGALSREVARALYDRYTELARAAA